MRYVGPNPITFIVQAGHAFSRGGVFRVPEAIPNALPDVQLVVQDTGATFSIAVNCILLPMPALTQSAARRKYRVLIQSSRYFERGDAIGVLLEDSSN